MKCLLKLALICGLAVLLLVGAVIFGLESLLTEALKAGVGHATGQSTALAGVDVEYTDKGLGFRGLEVANPPGFQETPLLRIGEIRASMQPNVVRGQTVLVDEIVLDGLELALELKGSESNVHALMERLSELQGESGSEPDAKAPTPPGESAPPQPAEGQPAESRPATPAAEAPKTQVAIRRVQISGWKASLRISDVPSISGTYSVTVPDIVLENLDTRMAEADLSVWVAVILEALLENALDAGKDVFPGEWQAILESELGKSLLKGDLDGAAKELEQQADAELQKLENQAEEAADDLLQQGKDALEKSGINKDPTTELQKELKKASDLRKGFFKD